MNRVHLGRSGSIVLVKLTQPVTCKYEGCYLTIVKVDSGQGTTVRQKVRSQKDICGLVVLDGDHLLFLN